MRGTRGRVGTVAALALIAPGWGCSSGSEPDSGSMGPGSNTAPVGPSSVSTGGGMSSGTAIGTEGGTSDTSSAGGATGATTAGGSSAGGASSEGSSSTTFDAETTRAGAGGTASTNSTDSTITTAGGVGGSGGALSDPDVPEGEACAEAAAWDPEFTAFEQEVLAVVNENRASGWDCGSEGLYAPADPLSMDPALRCAARLHSKDMNDRDFTDHQNPDGLAPDDRMAAAGYTGFTWGENIAWGQNTAEEAVDWWMNSDAHCANIMSPNYTLLGVGYYEGDGEWGQYWTQNFGSD